MTLVADILHKDLQAIMQAPHPIQVLAIQLIIPIAYGAMKMQFVWRYRGQKHTGIIFNTLLTRIKHPTGCNN